jgi:hypothetical protein
MNENIDSIVLRRQYIKNESYSYGDLVEYGGSSFLALRDGNLPAPSDEKDVWYRLSSTSKFYRTTTAPKFSEQGDKWFDPSSGVLYTRIEQTNGVMFWIEF